MINNYEIGFNEEKEVSNYFSVLGDTLIEPIVALVDRATSTRLAGPNQVQASCIENGYSSAIALLLVVMLEGMVNYVWLHYPEFEPKKRFSALEALKYYTDNRYNSEIEELFIIRDVIAHNHIWEAKIFNDYEKMVHAKEPNLYKNAFGDIKYKNNVDHKTRLTRVLGLNVFTTRINWNDVEVIFYNIIKILNHVEDNLKIRSLTRQRHYKFNDSWIYFEQLIEEAHKKREKRNYH